MNILERTKAAYRAFVLGPAVVGSYEPTLGHDSSTFTPPEYGNYLATSAAIYAIVSQRCEFLARLPLKFYRVGARGKRLEVTSGPLYDLWHYTNPWWDPARLLYMTEAARCMWGVAYWFLERGKTRQQVPQEIWWGQPDKVKVFPDATNYVDHFAYAAGWGGDPLSYRPDETVWLPLPNPLDEFSGLAPLAPARLAADYGQAALRANKLLFDQGMMIGGLITPPEGQTWTPEQAKDLAELADKRMKGLDRAHRWLVLRAAAKLQEAGYNPKDAQFIEGLKWALEEVARCYHWPLDLVSGQRTYENLNAALKAAWTNCVIPEGNAIAAGVTEQFLPLFPGEADLAEFDASAIEVLQEDEAQAWGRAKEQIGVGAITVNEWRETQGKTPLPWGDDPPAAFAPPGLPPLPEEVPPAATGAPEPPRQAPEFGARQSEYGGAEHRALWDTYRARTETWEGRITKVVTSLFRRQQQAILDQLQRGVRELDPAAPFDRAKWLREFRVGIRPVLKDLLAAFGRDALQDLGAVAAGLDFDVVMPDVLRFLEQRAQRFATQVTGTTWDALKQSLGAGVENGESIAQLAARVEQEMGARIASTPETIARTEVVGASNGGTLRAWEQSGVVQGKRWLSTLDDRTRETHKDMHGQTVALRANFVSSSGEEGPAPGQLGSAAEDIQCRCTMTAVVQGTAL